MGYQTVFFGAVNIEPALNDNEVEYLEAFSQSRRMHRTKGPLYVGGTGILSQGFNDGDILDHNHPDPDQPGLWCQWVPANDGQDLEWDGGEKFYNSAEWMKYLVENLLAPSAREYVDAHLAEDPRLKDFTCNHVVDGEIRAEGEDSEDRWYLVVEDNVVKVANAVISYVEARPI